MIQTLSLRDHMTARHCAAVARYSREIAREAGCSQDEQDLVHTAGLLHDIGKFIFPDSILLANTRALTTTTGRSSSATRTRARRSCARSTATARWPTSSSPTTSASTARATRSGLAGEDIPLLSRMISSPTPTTSMTARDSYRKPVAPGGGDRRAAARLRAPSSTATSSSCSSDLVERKGVAFRHGDDADFEAELDFERRVRSWAAPRSGGRRSVVAIVGGVTISPPSTSSGSSRPTPDRSR